SRRPLTSGSLSRSCPGPETGGRGGADWPARLRGERPKGDRAARAGDARRDPPWGAPRPRGGGRGPRRGCSWGPRWGCWGRGDALPRGNRATRAGPLGPHPLPPRTAELEDTWLPGSTWPPAARGPAPAIAHAPRRRPGSGPPASRVRAPLAAHSRSPAGCCPRRECARRGNLGSPWLRGLSLPAPHARLPLPGAAAPVAPGPKAAGLEPSQTREPLRASPPTRDPGEQRTMPRVAGSEGRREQRGVSSRAAEVARAPPAPRPPAGRFQAAGQPTHGPPRPPPPAPAPDTPGTEPQA
uniref:Uncharacterized protein n=1 Tax=Mustela putorius furo TaxID=9669 RepID=M3YL91_MUSPF